MLSFTRIMSNCKIINYKSFINVVILGSARYNPFMQMSSADRRVIIEELFDIEIFSSMNLLVKDKLSKLKEEEKEVTFNLELVKAKIKLQKENVKKQQKNIDELIEKFKKSFQKLKNLNRC